MDIKTNAAITVCADVVVQVPVGLPMRPRRSSLLGQAQGAQACDHQVITAGVLGGARATLAG